MRIGLKLPMLARSDQQDLNARHMRGQDEHFYNFESE